VPRLTYQPEGVDPMVFDIDFGRLMSPERIVIERLTDMGWDQVKQAFFRNSTPVIHAFLYVFLKRQQPTLLPKQVEFCDDDFEVDLTDAEALSMIAQHDPTDPTQAEAVAPLIERMGPAVDLDADDPKDEG
jgi:hypothetical protein